MIRVYILFFGMESVQMGFRKKDRAMDKRGIVGMLCLLILLGISSCATSKRASYEDKKRGFLMLEGEDIYKNKGFYKEKHSYAPYKKKQQGAQEKKESLQEKE